MGLPLWQPKVESDIPSRPEAKNPEAHARSRIRRRFWEGDSVVRTRERRRNLLQDMQERNLQQVNNNRTSGNTTNSMELGLDVVEPSRNAESGLHRSPAITARLRELGYLEERDQERLQDEPADGPAARLHQQLLNLRRARIEREAAAPRNLPNVDREALTRSLSDTRANASRQETQDLEEIVSLRRRQRMAAARLRQQQQQQQNEAPQNIWGDGPTDDRLRQPVRLIDGREAPATQPARFDGLGDRERSLSPENDNAWDTLLTTVTPDPQPPSVSSSFQSFLSSTAATRTPANESSNTSMTSREPGAAEESTVEQPCESDEEEEGDPVRFDVDMEDGGSVWIQTGDSYADVVRNAGYTMPSGVRTRTAPVARRLPQDVPDSGANSAITAPAAVTGAPLPRVRGRIRGHVYVHSNDAGSDDLILQLVGGLGGMQHIVRNLVRREDIPNDWWVDAGLSRTLPRDDSGNNDSGNDDAANSL